MEEKEKERKHEDRQHVFIAPQCGVGEFLSVIYGDGEMTTLKIWRELGVDAFARPLQHSSHPEVRGHRLYVRKYSWVQLMTSPSNAGREAFCVLDDKSVQHEVSVYSEICAPFGIR
ncbi:3 beta-hydroxysteroid dehydrogenase type 7 [Branchiostoma belcheri]|nr:3 beta-hydroxysteroid dehydrogenase type 7 [Branchiostoma belcheri]